MAGKISQGRRNFLKTIGRGSAALAFSGLANWQCAHAQKRHNVLFFFADDQRFDTIEALNNPHIYTPHLNRLVKKGVTFTRAHIMGGTSGAVCMPSRAMVLTGRTLFHIYNRGANISEEHVMFPEFLKKQGYSAFGTGKWHNHPDSYARCFSDGGNIFFGGMSDHLKVPVHDFDTSGEYAKNTASFKSKFSSELFSDAAIDFIQNNTDTQPFCVYISYTAPHDPRMAPKEYLDLYPEESIQLPENFMPKHPFDNGEMKVRDENLAPFPRTEVEIKKHIAGYYAMITHLDAQIGRVLDALEETGKDKNTIIIFSGDNGLAVGQHGLLGKQNIYDHSVRVPLIFAGPGIPEDQKADTLCYLLDIYPTLFELLGLPVPDTVEGISLVPALKNSRKKIRDTVFLAYRHFQRGVRTYDNWKLLRYNVRGQETTQLFNLNTDPWEANNLATDPAHKSQIERLTALLKTHMNELDDVCDLDKPNWGIPEEKYALTEVQHLGVGKSAVLTNKATPRYSQKGVDALVDGILATSDFNDGHWVGLHGEDLDAAVDLGKFQALQRITVNFLENQNSWIFLPSSLEFLLSSDGKTFVSQKIILFAQENNPLTSIKTFHAELKGQMARYVRILARNIGLCPKWHSGSGEKAWVFADEIVID